MGGWDKNLKMVVGISKDQRIKSKFVEPLLPSSGELTPHKLTASQSCLHTFFTSQRHHMKQILKWSI